MPRFCGFTVRVAVLTGIPVSQLRCVPDAISITVPSEVAIRLPSGENASDETIESMVEAGGPANERASAPLAAFHNVTSPVSADSVASFARRGRTRPRPSAERRAS